MLDLRVFSQRNLETPIGEDNVGFQLLAKMGFKEGSKLGKNENYQTPPYLRDLGQRGVRIAPEVSTVA